jgi:hypothetical protein
MEEVITNPFLFSSDESDQFGSEGGIDELQGYKESLAFAAMRRIGSVTVRYRTFSLN